MYTWNHSIWSRQAVIDQIDLNDLTSDQAEVAKKMLTEEVDSFSCNDCDAIWRKKVASENFLCCLKWIKEPCVRKFYTKQQP